MFVNDNAIRLVIEQRIGGLSSTSLLKVLSMKCVCMYMSIAVVFGCDILGRSLRPIALEESIVAFGPDFCLSSLFLGCLAELTN